MGTASPTEFYKERGLVRTGITLDRETIDFLGDKAKEYSEKGNLVTQGEVVIIMSQLLAQDQGIAAKFEQLMNGYKAEKAAEREALKEKKKKLKKLMKEGKLDHLLENDE